MTHPQMYMVELFIDKITVFVTDDEPQDNISKNMIFKISFGPKAVFILKEGHFNPVEKKDDIAECGADGRRKWIRTIRVGKSYLFPSFPDIVISTLSKFTLEVEVWDDDLTDEHNIYVGTGITPWDREFYEYLFDSSDHKKVQSPFAMKLITVLYAECCCRICGEVTWFLRVAALGETVITEYQPIPTDPDYFVFRTNKSPTMVRCTRTASENPNFCMIGSIYETITLEDPDVVAAASKKIEVCTELESCGAKGIPGIDYRCTTAMEDQPRDYGIKKIKLGEILGPCGNHNCPVVRKVKNYIRNLESYKEKTKNMDIKMKEPDPKRKVCGKDECVCKDEKFHRSICPVTTGEDKKDPKHICIEKEKPPAGKGTCGPVHFRLEDCDSHSKPSGSPVSPPKPSGSPDSPPKPSGSPDSPSKPSGSPAKKQSSTNVNYLLDISHPSDLMTSLFGASFTGHGRHKKSFNDNDSTLREEESRRRNKHRKHSKRGPTNIYYITDIIYDNPELNSTPFRRDYTVGHCSVINYMKETRTRNNNRSRLSAEERPKLGPSLVSQNNPKRPISPKRLSVSTRTSIASTRGADFPYSFSAPQSSITTKTSHTSRTSRLSRHGMPFFPDSTSGSPSAADPFNSFYDPDKYPSMNCNCKCDPPKSTAPCNAHDCPELFKNETDGIDSTFSTRTLRSSVGSNTIKPHRQYCKLYNHKLNCPLVKKSKQPKEMEEYEEKIEPLPYGLSPVELKPCPVKAHPCTHPDGFARMYKAGALPKLEQSYQKSQKICCSEEYNRIKKAIKEMLQMNFVTKIAKGDDFRCLKNFYVGTETRCCDKNQSLGHLFGQNCCTEHWKEGLSEQRRPSTATEERAPPLYKDIYDILK